MSESDLDLMVEKYHRALDAFVKGDPEQQKKLFSKRDDVTLATVVWALDQAPRTYQTPVRGGAVRITSASGSLLTLTTAQGTHTVFDAAAGQFV